MKSSWDEHLEIAKRVKQSKQRQAWLEKHGLVLVCFCIGVLLVLLVVLIAIF